MAQKVIRASTKEIPPLCESIAQSGSLVQRVVLRKKNRRKIQLGGFWDRVFGIVMCLLCTAHAEADPQLYVFVPADQRPHAVKEILDRCHPELDTKVFGRFRDLWNEVEHSPPDLLLSLEPVVGQLKGYTISLRGKRNSLVNEPWLMIRQETTSSPPSIEEAIGVVSFLDRSDMESHVKALLPQSVSRIKQVAKPEDLLALLSLRQVDAVLVSAYHWENLREKSRLNVQVGSLAGQELALPVVAVGKTGLEAGKVKNILESFRKSTCKIYGVEEWSTDK